MVLLVVFILYIFFDLIGRLIFFKQYYFLHSFFIVVFYIHFIVLISFFIFNFFFKVLLSFVFLFFHWDHCQFFFKNHCALSSPHVVWNCGWIFSFHHLLFANMFAVISQLLFKHIKYSLPILAAPLLIWLPWLIFLMLFFNPVDRTLVVDENLLWLVAIILFFLFQQVKGILSFKLGLLFFSFLVPFLVLVSFFLFFVGIRMGVVIIKAFLRFVFIHSPFIKVPTSCQIELKFLRSEIRWHLSPVVIKVVFDI